MIAGVPNDLDWVRVHTECVDPEDRTCHPRNTNLYIKARYILSARFIMRKKLKKDKVLKTPKRHFTFNFSFLTPFLLGGGWGGVDCLPPLYLLNNCYCGIFLNVYKLCNFL